MSGCFGNSDYDQQMERELDYFLDCSFNYTCNDCDHEFDEELRNEDGEPCCPECMGTDYKDNTYDNDDYYED